MIKRIRTGALNPFSNFETCLN